MSFVHFVDWRKLETMPTIDVPMDINISYTFNVTDIFNIICQTIFSFGRGKKIFKWEEWCMTTL